VAALHNCEHGIMFIFLWQVKGDVEKAISILNKAVEKDKVSIVTTFSVLQE